MNEATGLQAILKHYLPAYQQDHQLNPQQQKVCHHIQQCRTEQLGGLLQQCTHCGYERPQYHSCRDRHCPQCQGQAQIAWSEQQLQSVLPVNYFHLVFTLPHQLNGWVGRHPEVIYKSLFQSAWHTLDSFGHDPKRLNGTLGVTAVLHTWGQNLSRHVHLHCLVPGGALTEKGQWQAAKSNYLFPVKAISRHFRGTMVSLLRAAAKHGKLHGITRAGEIDQILNSLMQIDWVVYTKAFLKHPETVVNYLARYSRKTALNNSRLQRDEHNHIRLSYKDYRDHNRQKFMTLEGVELIRRFLLHVLPSGFMRIRHYGFLANRCRQKKLQQIRRALMQQPANQGKNEQPSQNRFDHAKDYNNEESLSLCPECQQGPLLIICEIAPKRLEYG
mgnify:FL=1